MEKPTKLIVDLSKPKGEREMIVELTDEEISEKEQIAAEAEANRLAQQQAEAERESAKESAKNKLTALGLSESEALALLGQ